MGLERVAPAWRGAISAKHRARLLDGPATAGLLPTGAAHQAETGGAGPERFAFSFGAP